MVYPTGGVVYVRPELGIESAAGLRDLGDRRLTFGSLGATSLDLVPMLGFELLGLNVAPIFGIRGRSAGLLAFQRGDATIDFQTSAAYLRNVVPLVAEGKAIPLFTLGSLNENGDLVRDPQFPELPHFGEVYEMLHGDSPNGIEWESWFAFYSAGFGAQKLLVIPRDTPDEIVATYRTALEAMRDDPDYIEQKPAALGAYTQVTGEAAERLYNLGTNVPDEARRWIKKWLRSRYKLRI